MYGVGDKVRFDTDSKDPHIPADILTIEAVSADGLMVKADDGWFWLDHLVLVGAAPPADPLDAQLRFLDL